MKRNSFFIVGGVTLFMLAVTALHVGYAAEAGGRSGKGKQGLQPDYRLGLTGKPDPFRPFVEKDVTLKKKAEAVAAVSIFPLQKLALDQFNLIGIASAANHQIAVVETKDSRGSKFYTLTRGTIIGLHKGKVVEINNDFIVVEEAPSPGTGKKTNRIIKKLRKDEEGTP